MNAILRRVRPEQVRVLILLLIILIALAFFGSQIENYFSPRFFNRIATSAAIVAVVAVGQTLVVLTRNIDLSVGSIVGFTAYFVGTQLANNNGISPLVVVLMAMGLGALLGVINGLLVAYGRVPSIIVTLGTLAIYRTFLVEYSGAKTVTTMSLPEWLVNLPQVTMVSIGELDFRLLTVVALVVVAIFQTVLMLLPWGRRLYAIGSNPEAAHIVGLPVERTVFSAFVICGALSGLAGFMFLARFGNITVVAGQGLELQVVAAVVVGGVNMFGGSGTVVGALLGTVLIDLLEQSLIRWLEISEFWRDAILGLLILLAVAADAILLKRLQNFWAQRLQAESSETQVPAEGGQSHAA
jgi:rhamnose transport system permease protein